MRKLQKTIGLALFALLALNMATTFLASCSPDPSTIYVDPASFSYDASTTSIGTLFNVTVKVNNIVDMKAWQVKMWFNDSIINVTRWYEPKSDPTYVFYGLTTLPVPAPPKPAYGSGGWLGAGASLFPSPPVGEGFTGNGLLCILTFNITALPPLGRTYSCALNITNYPDTFWIKAGQSVKSTFDQFQNGHYEIASAPAPYVATIDAYCNTEAKGVSVNIVKDGMPTGYTTPHSFTGLLGNHNFTVSASDPGGHMFVNWSTGEISTTVTLDSGGTFTAYYEAGPTPVGTKLYVDPPEIIDPTMLPSSTFDINVTVDDVASMLSCEFNLTYNANVIQWIGIRTFKIFGQTPTAHVMIDDQAGFIWVKLQYGNAFSTSSPTALVRISFHVEALGVSVLDLHDTTLLDANGEPIDHETVDGFFMSLIRDVAIVNVIPSRTWAYPGWPVNVTITAKNLGNISETFDVKAYYDTTLIGTAPIVDLAPNAERNVTIAWNTTGVDGGLYTMKGEATTVPYEYNVTNNVYSDGTVQILTVIRDVAVIGVLPERTWVYQGWTAKINVTVANLGEVAESFDVAVHYDSNTIQIFHVTSLGPSTQLVLECAWNTTSVTPCHNYTIRGEATTVPYEYNVTNNVYVDGAIKVRILGDANGDGTVDMADVSLVIEAFLTYPGHPLYNPDVDFDQSNSVDMVDISIVIENFNKTCTP
jgi:hypothetical protein